MFGAQHYYERLPPNGTFHIWDKRGSYKEVHTADFDTVWVNRKEVGRMFRCVWRGLCRETEWDQKILHPTQKPVRIIRWIMEMFPDYQVVLDPFMGSGTTLRAAKDLGRKAIGIEIEERYCEIAVKRMSQEVIQFDSAFQN
jgi:site-specific DNA-methyltransferase (adenine-specific)